MIKHFILCDANVAFLLTIHRERFLDLDFCLAFFEIFFTPCYFMKNYVRGFYVLEEL